MLCGNQQQYENISFLSFYDDVFHFIRIKLKNYPILAFRFAAGLENFCFHFNYLVFFTNVGLEKKSNWGDEWTQYQMVTWLRDEKSCALQRKRSDRLPKATTDRCLFSMSWRIVGTTVHSIFSYQKEVCHQKQHFGPDWIRVVDAFLCSYWNYESVGADTDANSFHVISIKG